MQKVNVIILLLLLVNTINLVKADNSECVILLHGMGRTSHSMRSIEEHLLGHGYHMVNQSYPSTTSPIEEVVKKHIPEHIDDCQKNASKIHFVTHSLGGIVIRSYLQSNSLPKGSRIVMLSPPNKGSEIADELQEFTLYQWFTGPPGQQLTTDPDSLPNKLKPIRYEVGIITGKRSYEPWFSQIIPGEDDGKVSVQSARLKEMKDFLVVDQAHPFIMDSDIAKKEVAHFLKYGYFSQSSQKIIKKTVSH